MDPVEDFNHQLLLFAAMVSARSFAALERAGMLSEVDRKSVRGQLGLLEEKCAAITHDEGARVYLDMLVRLLPPLPNG
jgi:hypothetical protein